MISSIKDSNLLTSSERKKALWLFFLMLIGMALEMLSIGLVVPFMGALMQSNLAEKYPYAASIIEYLNLTNTSEIILAGTLFLIAVYLIKNTYIAFLIWKQTSFTYNLQQRVSERLFKKYLYADYTFHLQRNSAELIKNVTTEVTYLTHAINSVLLISTEALIAVGIVTLLFVVEPYGALTVVSTLIIAGLTYSKLTKKKVLSWGVARQVHDGKKIQHLQQGLGGIKEAKLYGREELFINEFNIHNETSAQINAKQTLFVQLPRLLLEFFSILSLGALVMAMILQGTDHETMLPTLALFAAAAFRLMPSANRLLSAYQTLRFNMPVINTLHKELFADAVTKPSVDFSSFKLKNYIDMTNISYSYDGTKNSALSNLSLSIQKGEAVGFIGASGSGKSTLVDILMGLLTPSEGVVTIDGVDIQEVLPNWQRQIGYVPQTIYLTDDTLKKNIAFGIPENLIDDSLIEKAIESAQLKSFVSNLPEGINTKVGEQGIRLSGGQRQRIGLARALYHMPEVIVLDEATSALDNQTEKYVMQAIDALQGDKTILIIAHRLSTVNKCDKIYKLDAGRVVSYGPPETMLKHAL